MRRVVFSSTSKSINGTAHVRFPSPRRERNLPSQTSVYTLENTVIFEFMHRLRDEMCPLRAELVLACVGMLANLRANGGEVNGMLPGIFLNMRECR